VTETFSSIQGEGLAMGRPCFFIRLSGCNLRCNWCDTRYAWRQGEELPLDMLAAKWLDSGIPLIQITGGEPLLQPAILPLMEYFLEQGATVLLETNGSIDISRVPGRVVKIVDRKTPSSGMVACWAERNAGYLRAGDQLKFVLGDRQDYVWACRELERLNLRSGVEVLFSPVAGRMNPGELAEWIVADRLSVRFQLQLHKALWGHRRGV